MKKAYFITWLGAIATFLISFITAKSVAKKYGELPKNKFRINFNKILNESDKIFEFVNNKIK